MKTSLFIKILLLAVLVAAAFAPCLRAGYLNWDDPVHVRENIYANSLSPASLKGMFTTSINKVYIPFTTLSHALERKLFGKSPLVPHAINVLLHIGVTLAVFFLCLRLGLSELAAFLAALLFGLHPVHVESVAWITERKDVLFGLFYLLALYHYWGYAGRNNDPERGTVDGGRWTVDEGRNVSVLRLTSYVSTKKASYVWALAFGVLSVLAKPMAVSLPWVLFLMDWLAGRKCHWRLLWEKVPSGALICGIAFVTFAQHARALDFSFPRSFLIWIWSAMFYVRTFFFPVGLSPVRLLPEPVAILNPEYMIALALLAVLLTALWRFRRDRWFVFAVLFWAGTMFFLWRWDYNDVDIVAERFLYIPSVGLCVLVGVWLEKGWKAVPRPGWRSVLFCLTIILFSSLAARTFLQCRVWKNDRTLWEDVIRQSPGHFIAYDRLAVYYFGKGDNDKALLYNQKALAIRPGYAAAVYNAGVILKKMGRTREAIDVLDRTVSLAPKMATAYYERGRCYLILGDESRALADFDRAVEENPQLFEVYNERGILLAKRKQWQAALSDFNRILAVDPRNIAVLSNRANLSRIQGQYDRALADYDRVLALDPGNQKALEYGSRIRRTYPGTH